MKKDGVIRPAGLPTEAALKVLNEKIGNYDGTFKRSGNIEEYNDKMVNG